MLRTCEKIRAPSIVALASSRPAPRSGALEFGHFLTLHCAANQGFVREAALLERRPVGRLLHDERLCGRRPTG
ncbi:MAG TPA: hypothetical protein VGL91_12415, partial [Acidobacteriota bacterium]